MQDIRINFLRHRREPSIWEKMLSKVSLGCQIVAQEIKYAYREVAYVCAHAAAEFKAEFEEVSASEGYAAFFEYSYPFVY